MEVVHLLKRTTLRVEHTPYRNRGTYIAMKAYLHQLQGSYQEALASAEEAEEILKADHPTDFSRQVLVTYGNFAWIHYHMMNYDMVEIYLGRIQQICHSLASTEPYSILIPEIYTQKGWSLLAGGFRNGKEAEQCFRMALKADAAANEEFKAGLAISLYASWTHSWEDENEEEARKMLQDIVQDQPRNAEAKVFLASVLLKTRDSENACSLLEDIVQHSVDPEVLRNAAKLWKEPPLQNYPKAISILQHLLALHPTYHLLHSDLGICYLKQLERACPEERAEMVETAIECFRQALDKDPRSVFTKLKLATLYGEKAPDHAEKIFQNLLEELPHPSKRCQQAIYLHWGNFLLHKKGLKHQALKMYQASCSVLGDHPAERQQLLMQLRHLARMFQADSQPEQAAAV